jgi:hypothetical protein
VWCRTIGMAAAQVAEPAIAPAARVDKGDKGLDPSNTPALGPANRSLTCTGWG